MAPRLLVVDDDPRVTRAYEQHFSRVGFAVESAGSEGDALRRMAARPFDAAILDVSLTRAGAEGLRLAARLRKRQGRRPAVVVTAYGVPVHARAAARVGVDAFLHKPVSLEWLEDLLRDAIAAREVEAAASR